jgi:ssRNA-specific RNase YbeY (16S rRNA maturation enzyme)
VTHATQEPAVDVLVEDDRWTAALDGRPDDVVAEAVAAAARMADAAIDPGSEVSVVLTDDERIRLLNRDHRG